VLLVRAFLEDPGDEEMELTESPQMRNGDMGQKVTSKGLVGEAANSFMTG